ncbi:MAG: hypothetical protein ACLSHC_03445 [Bilophila wadsworthia]
MSLTAAVLQICAPPSNCWTSTANSPKQTSTDPVAELCGAYRHIGAGGTVARPTRIGPAMLFNKVKGHPGARVAIGVLSSRKRAALLLGTEPERLGWHLMDALQHLISLPPSRNCPLSEAVHRADDPGFDLRRLVPAPPIPRGRRAVCRDGPPCTGKIRKTATRT